ncbi:MAG: DUF5615 family PIN-like protein [Bryobacteraceae bacterium]
MTTILALRQLGHDVAHLSELGLIRMEDSDIVAKAQSEARIILTFDLDFGEIMALSANASPSVILFWMQNQTPHVVRPRLLHVLKECEGRRRIRVQGAPVAVSRGSARPTAPVGDRRHGKDGDRLFGHVRSATHQRRLAEFLWPNVRFRAN